MVSRLILVISGPYNGLYGAVSSFEGMRIEVRTTLQAGGKFPTYVTLDISEVKFID